MAAFGALVETPGSDLIALVMAALGADEAVRPFDLKEMFVAGLLVREVFLEREETPDRYCRLGDGSNEFLVFHNPVRLSGHLFDDNIIPNTGSTGKRMAEERP